LILGRWIKNEWLRLDQGKRAALRPKQQPDDEFRGGAMAGLGYLAIQSTSSRKKNTSG
jgi:hypothetical protein